VRPDVFVRRIRLPLRVRGVTLPNDDATYSVYLNAALPAAQQEETLAHELYHIEHDHLYRNDPLDLQERLADLRPRKEPEAAYGFVRQGNVLFWQKLGPGDRAEQIRPGDVLKKRVPSRSLPLGKADVAKGDER